MEKTYSKFIEDPIADHELQNLNNTKIQLQTSQG